ncbi:outer membrane beta-barrel protein [Hyunsoonleella ulvae]|uniref:outer membrane beta-barrel protein n=1 Tax=Hyunsoonleella ulvae TaxID=2799948 RepID=UPI001939886C|nr:outer membrane beta-barrel protein [Hyunsoonleella ulvae]
MKKTLFFVLLLITLKGFAQDSKFSIGVNYSIPFDHNFIADNYNGVIDLGLDYKLYSAKVLSLGLAINVGLLISDNSVIDLNIKSYVIQPKLFAEFNISRFHPFLKIGYSSMIFRTKGFSDRFLRFRFDGMSLNNTQSGLNINPGLKYDINNDFFVQAQYDYILLGAESPIQNSRYNVAVHIIKLGLGINL